MKSLSRKAKRVDIPDNAELTISHFLDFFGIKYPEDLAELLRSYPFQHLRIVIYLGTGLTELQETRFVQILQKYPRALSEISLVFKTVPARLFRAILSCKSVFCTSIIMRGECCVAALELLNTLWYDRCLVLHLDFRDSTQGDSVAICESLLLTLRTKKVVALCITGIDLPGSALAGEISQSRTLKSLHLRDLEFSEDFKQFFLAGFADNRCLLDLAICRCDLGDNGLKRLAKSLQMNTTIEVLVLAANGLTDQGIIPLSNALRTNKACGVILLRFVDDDIGKAGGVALAEMLLFNTSLMALHLHYCNIGDGAFQSFKQALKTNDSLRYLDLCFCDFTFCTYNKLNAVAQEKGTLHNLNYEQNDRGYSKLNHSCSRRYNFMVAKEHWLLYQTYF